MLTVASRTARKNLGALEIAARRLAGEGIELVAAGGDRPQFRDGAGSSSVRFLGHVDDADLPGLYAGALAFVLPSLHEGFGLTALEAMACGTPVVAARAGALPETAATRRATPTRTTRRGSRTRSRPRSATRRLRAAGPRRAAQFTWERTVREMGIVLAERA